MKTKNKIIIGAPTPFALFILLCLLAIPAAPGPISAEPQEKTENATTEEGFYRRAQMRQLGKEGVQKVYSGMKEDAEKWKTLRGNARNEQEYRQCDMAYKSALEAAEIIKKDAAKAKIKIKD